MKIENILSDNIGSIELVEHLGTDLSIVSAARVSYNSSSKGEEADKKLLSYLWKNKHCYHPDMEVLTIDGWKKWSDCRDRESFLIPFYDTGTYRIQELEVKSWNVQNETLFCYENNRMSYKVTSEHKMYFMPKYQNKYSVYKVSEMPLWGHFRQSSGIKYLYPNIHTDLSAAIAGFYLGDGFLYSKNIISFRLKKQRKIDFLEELLDNSKIKYDKNYIVKDKVYQYKINIDDLDLLRYVDVENKTANKQIKLSLDSYTQEELLGLFTGLINSDGSYKDDRPQINFSSISEKLLQQFQVLSQLNGIDCHFTGKNTVTSFFGERTTLESRKEYHYTETYTGKVYCTTSSTGLLMVRGASDKFGFVCGNSSPFEMCSFKVIIKCPLFVRSQIFRHRLFSFNEISRRYTSDEIEFYFPNKWRRQSFEDKQASMGVVPSSDTYSVWLKDISEVALNTYNEMLSFGVAREQARMVLPQNLYTKFVMFGNLRNWLHFCELRSDGHAQWETRQYSDAILHKIISDLYPETYKIIMENT